MEVRGNALVIGAGGCIGSQVVDALILNGVTTIFGADIKLEAAQATLEACKARAAEQGAHIETHALYIDVTKEDKVQEVFRTVKEKVDRLDYVVNASGIGNPGSTPIASTPLETYISLDTIHNVGTFLILREALKIMLDQELISMPVKRRVGPSAPGSMIRGSIALVVSLGSEGAVQGVGPYTAAKHACAGLVKTAAIENGKDGIRINAVCPSYVSSPMINEFLDKAPEWKGELLADLPLKRLVEPQEVADAVVFLCSAASSYINGQMLRVDGGASAALVRGVY